MARGSLQPCLWLSLFSIILSSVHSFTMDKSDFLASHSHVKSSTFRSPPFVLGPGQVQNNYYHGIPFPEGHIAIKGFDAEVVDEFGNSIPLSEVYLHHWVVAKLFSKAGVGSNGGKAKDLLAKRDGVCGSGLSQFFGLGSETRHTNSAVPDPYGIESGNPESIPDGYEEAWLLNVHAIDTRGAVDPMGCLECRCDLYNVTIDEFGRPIKEDYIGGLYCCYDKTQCKIKDSFEGPRRTLYLQYTIYWVEWDESIIPVEIFILDSTFDGKKCNIEYNVPSCDMSHHGSNCVHMKEAFIPMPVGGDIIYSVSHQHLGGIGATLYSEDGHEICTSVPLYGEGHEAGNEAGYVVGMSSCYPKPGSMKVRNGEKLRLVSRYSRVMPHTGVMGLSYLLIDTRTEVSLLQSVLQSFKQETKGGFSYGTALPVIVVAVAIVSLLMSALLKKKNDVYKPLTA